MEQLPVNPNCELSGTKYCRLLNMHDCNHCTVHDSDSLKQVREDLDVYETLLPEGGVSRLFTDRECQFCKGSQKGKRSGFAIIDMAHPQPKRVQKWLLGKRTLKIGTMIPVQMSICSSCRRRLMWMEYLPVAVPVIAGAVGLVLLAVGPLTDALSKIGSFLPFAVWAALVVIGIVVGQLWAKALKKKSSEKMIVHVLEHPVLAEMTRLGWSPVGARDASAKLLFSKSRLARGLGTAVDEQILPEEHD